MNKKVQFHELKNEYQYLYLLIILFLSKSTKREKFDKFVLDLLIKESLYIFLLNFKDPKKMLFSSFIFFIFSKKPNLKLDNLFFIFILKYRLV